MTIVWGKFFDSIASAIQYISTLPAQGRGGYPVYKVFRAKRGRVLVRCQRARGHCSGR